MNKKNNTPELDEYEKEILDAYENGALAPTIVKTDFRKVAGNTLINTPAITLASFTYLHRQFFVTLEKSLADGAESIQLSEVVRVRGKPLKHFMKSDGTLVKTDPLIFACKNTDSGEIEVSMQYEGLPLEPLKRFLKVIEERWE